MARFGRQEDGSDQHNSTVGQKALLQDKDEVTVAYPRVDIAALTYIK
jgi:hypothetical protein